MIGAAIFEWVAMKLRYKTRGVFDRYNVGSDGDLRDAARRLGVASSAVAAGGRAGGRAQESAKSLVISTR
jgi:hypothetical protein